MSVIVSIYTAILFFLLTPAILLRLPPNGNKWTVAIVHALVFGLIFHFTHKIVWRLGARLEGFDGYEDSASSSPSPSPSSTRKSEQYTD